MISSCVYSVLRNVTHAAIDPDPFPHVVRQPALDEDLYAELAASFPPDGLLLAGATAENNRYYQYSAAESLADPRVSDVWKEFIRYHVSAQFFEEVVALFPQLENIAGRSPRTSVRFAEPMADVALDCQFFYCSPAIADATTSRSPHIDREVAAFGGMLYFRLPEDRASGADLDLFRLRGGARREYGVNRAVPADSIERVKTIPYAPNTFVLFPNSPDSIHGVSPRAMTPHPRLHVNFMAEVRTKLFDISPWST